MDYVLDKLIKFSGEHCAGKFPVVGATTDIIDAYDVRLMGRDGKPTNITSRTSYVIAPANGRVPALTAEGQQRQAAFRGGQSNGPFFTTRNFSYYDRCITRGISGSIMPSLYGDAMRIVPSPTEVAISYEMLHDTRVIPLDGRALPGDGVSQFMGASIGHYEGDTLVVETRNLTDKLAISRYPHSLDAVLTERFTRIDPDMIDYEVRVDDPLSLRCHGYFLSFGGSIQGNLCLDQI